MRITDSKGTPVRIFRDNPFDYRYSTVGRVWDGTDSSGKKVESGTYFVQAVINNTSAHKLDFKPFTLAKVNLNQCDDCGNSEKKSFNAKDFRLKAVNISTSSLPCHCSTEYLRVKAFYGIMPNNLPAPPPNFSKKQREDWWIRQLSPYGLQYLFHAFTEHSASRPISQLPNGKGRFFTDKLLIESVLQSYFERSKTSLPEGDIDFSPRTVGEMFIKAPGTPRDGEPSQDISIVKYLYEDVFPTISGSTPNKCHVYDVYPKQ